mmetsp:Transcript_5717/g.20818  ORF Transcript_5717/g.20818 Transcript_5717/m.20818 type:complete len:97 (+) Transcript_5717:1107-1397(+)
MSRRTKFLATRSIRSRDHTATVCHAKQSGHTYAISLRQWLPSIHFVSKAWSIVTAAHVTVKSPVQSLLLLPPSVQSFLSGSTNGISLSPLVQYTIF